MPPETDKSLWLSRLRLPENQRGYSSEPFIPKNVRATYDSAIAITKETFAEPIQEQRGSTSLAVNCTLSCLPVIEHDFNAYGLCRVSVGLDIQYSDEVEELLIKPYAGGMSSPGDFQQFYRGYPLMIWSTACRRIQLFADPSALENGLYRRRLELRAIVTVPGIYDISSLKFSCRRRGAEWEDLPLLQSQFLTVIQSSRTEYSQLRSNPETSIYYSMS